MAIKLIVFWAGSILFLFSGFFACRVFKSAVYVVFGLMILSLGNIDTFSITFFAHESYKMATRGFEVSLADLCAIVLFLHLITSVPKRELVKFPPMMVPQLLFIGIAILSWSFSKSSVANPLAGINTGPRDLALQQAMEPIFQLWLYPWFEITKLFRGMLIFWITVNLSKDETFIKVMYAMFAVMILYFTAKSLFLRYVLHVNRVTAGIGHYNNFNTFIGLMGSFLLPLAFIARRFITSAGVWLLILCTVICIVLTISRSALFAFGIVLIIGTPIMMSKFFNGRNLLFVMLGIVAVLGVLAKSENTLRERFVYKNPTQKSYLQREALIVEAKMMAKDFPLGVGLGNFSAWSILRYSSLTGAEPGNFAHNSFYLALGETGYLGAAIFLMFWLRYIQLGFVAFILRYFEKDNLALAITLGADLAILFLIPQLWFQFTYRVTGVYLLVYTIIGVGVRQYLMAVEEQPAAGRRALTPRRRSTAI